MALRMRTIALLSLVVLPACSAPPRIAVAARPGEPVLTVATYNVNFGLEGDPAGIEAIRATDADLVVLQETTPSWEQALRRELGAAYPRMVFRHHGAAGGMAVLSRVPVKEEEWIDSPSGWFPGWRLVATTKLGKVQLLAVHLHPPVSEGGSYVSGYVTTGRVREEELGAFLDGLDPELPTLVLGDFNEEEDGDACQLLVARGMVSVLRDWQPDQPTWRWQTSLGHISFRLDHVFHDRALAPLEARALEAGRSDHLPVVVKLRRAP